MKYFAIDFLNHTTYVVVTPNENYEAATIARDLKNTIGFQGHQGAIYNPTFYISISEIFYPDERQKNMALNLDEVFVWA